MAYLRNGAPPGSRCTCGIKALFTLFTMRDVVASYHCKRHSDGALQELRTAEARELLGPRRWMPPDGQTRVR